MFLLLGIQFAGSHLRELQKAFKNPAANLSVIMGEATKRAIRSVGLSSSPSLSPFVDPALATPANQTSKVILWNLQKNFVLNKFMW